MTETLPRQAEGWAFFLDFDGTLVEIAEAPDTVVVPGELPALLTRLAEKAKGALAIVSGRPIATLDRLLAPARFAAAGVHGAELHLPDGRRISPAAPGGLDRARRVFADFAAQHPGLLVEDKGMAVALHYRGAPEFAAAATDLANAAAAGSKGAVIVQSGKMVVELRPAGADKGMALATLMGYAPFRGRRPIAIGDDLTDETMFAAARRLGGAAVHVGAGAVQNASSAHFADPASLRRWLATLE